MIKSPIDIIENDLNTNSINNYFKQNISLNAYNDFLKDKTAKATLTIEAIRSKEERVLPFYSSKLSFFDGDKKDIMIFSHYNHDENKLKCELDHIYIATIPNKSNIEDLKNLDIDLKIYKEYVRNTASLKNEGFKLYTKDTIIDFENTGLNRQSHIEKEEANNLPDFMERQESGLKPLISHIFLKNLLLEGIMLKELQANSQYSGSLKTNFNDNPNLTIQLNNRSTHLFPSVAAYLKNNYKS